MMQNREEAIKLLVWSRCPKDYFVVCIVPQFNDNLITQFNEGKGYLGIRIIKHLSLKYKKRRQVC